ncbi:MAG: nicotinamide riboside transporter PnuC [Gammaproteobacteria bacterium]|nr:nicotinamide riboside transporter PnuC [Gammaproteobacteria bacterium]
MESIDILMMGMEYTGTVIGVLVVLCLIYEKVWAWPLGVLFCVLSAPVMWHNNLYGYLTLTLIGFLPMNLYGWYYWLFGTEHKAELPITLTPRIVWLIAITLSVVAIFLLPYFFDLIVPNYFEEAEYIYLDNSILVLSLVAMWYTARKHIENWFIWFIVNVGTVTLYALTELWGFMVLYVLYIGMAIWGYLQWRRSMDATSSSESLVT